LASLDKTIYYIVRVSFRKKLKNVILSFYFDKIFMQISNKKNIIISFRPFLHNSKISRYRYKITRFVILILFNI